MEPREEEDRQRRREELEARVAAAVERAEAAAAAVAAAVERVEAGRQRAAAVERAAAAAVERAEAAAAEVERAAAAVERNQLRQEAAPAAPAAARAARAAPASANRPVFVNTPKKSGSPSKETTCPICYVELTEIPEDYTAEQAAIVLVETVAGSDPVKCGHKFHKKCIEDWFRQSNKCPLDNQHVIKYYPLSTEGGRRHRKVRKTRKTRKTRKINKFRI